VDDREHVLTCGDGKSAVASGNTDSVRWTELWEIVCGNHAGRTNENDVTLFKSVGNALQDLALAAAVYRKAKESGIGKEIGEFPHLRV
jgi:ornithine cyclodeaminase/alanine dehydrogenase-like protein (mu-crystallin family)